MSRAIGMVKFNDGNIMYCIYDGTSDIMHNKLFKTSDEAWHNYHNNFSYDNECTCNGEDVLIHSSYGIGETYTGKACKEHKCIIFDFNNFIECEINNRELRWFYQNYTNEQKEKEKIEHEQILKNNWMKKGNHLD
jgi:hypothetical protein